LLEPFDGSLNDLIQARVQVGEHPFLVESFDADVNLLNKLFLLQDKVLATNLLDCRQRDEVSVNEWVDQVAEKVK